MVIFTFLSYAHPLPTTLFYFQLVPHAYIFIYLNLVWVAFMSMGRGSITLYIRTKPKPLDYSRGGLTSIVETET